MASMPQVAFKVEPIIMKGLAYLVLCSCEDTLEFIWMAHQANTTSAAARSGLEHQREVYFPGGFQPFSKRAKDGRTWEHWQSSLGHGFTGGDFIAHDCHNRGGRADKGDIDVGADFGKAGVF